MNEKIKSTSEQFTESLSPKELKDFQQEYKEIVLSEILLAIKEQDTARAIKLLENNDITSLVYMLYSTRKKNGKKSTNNMMASKNYNRWVSHQLNDPELAIEYLNEALKDPNQRMFIIELKNILRALDYGENGYTK